jgi:hypothetical protein
MTRPRRSKKRLETETFETETTSLCEYQRASTCVDACRSLNATSVNAELSVNLTLSSAQRQIDVLIKPRLIRASRRALTLNTAI